MRYFMLKRLCQTGLLVLVGLFGNLTLADAEPVKPAIERPDSMANALTVLRETQSNTLPARPITMGLEQQSSAEQLSLPLNQVEPAPKPIQRPPDWPTPINDSQSFGLLLFDQLEYQSIETFNWDLQGWRGGDYKRFVIKSEGSVDVSGEGDSEAEVQLLYSQLVAPYWEVQAGIRYEQQFGNDNNRGRAFAVVGIQGLAPYLFEVDASLFVSQNGDLSARLLASRQFLLSQRLVLEPSFETNLAAQQVKDFGVGTGLNDISLGLRLRYEVSREFAPYVGLSWTKKFAGTADLARQEGSSAEDFAVVGGFRLMF